jgi:hypothetical protein
MVLPTLWRTDEEANHLEMCVQLIHFFNSDCFILIIQIVHDSLPFAAEQHIK